MIDFYQWLINSGDNIQMRNFRAGYVVGALIVILLLIIVKIVYYYAFGRRKKVTEIKIPAEGGTLFISSGALIDLVKIVAADFDYFKVVKVALWETKVGITMRVKVKYDILGKQYPELCQELKKELWNNLQGRLGVDNIRFIEIKNVTTTNNTNSKF